MNREIACPPGLTIEPIGMDKVLEYVTEVAGELHTLAGQGGYSQELVKFEKSYLSNIRLYEWYGAQFFAVRDAPGEMCCLLVAKFNSSPRKNAWGRYINHYLAYTRPYRRGEGFAVHGELQLQALAAANGYDRLKTLCQSWLGVLYHEHLRDLMWGTNDKGELVIDSPLHEDDWPEGVPIKARQWNKTGAELTLAEVFGIVTDPKGRFRATRGDAMSVLAKREWRRRDQDLNLGGSNEPTRLATERFQPDSATPPAQ